MNWLSQNKELLFGLIGGLGIGSLLKSAIDHLINRRAAKTDRLYREKREAYLGLLDALHQAAVRPSPENAKQFALWQTRCELFGSPEVATFAQEMVNTNDARDRRDIAFRSLVNSMREDLRR